MVLAYPPPIDSEAAVAVQKIWVHPETCEVTFHQVAERRWLATGLHNGASVRVEGTSAANAADRWVEKAARRYRNG